MADIRANSQDDVHALFQFKETFISRWPLWMTHIGHVRPRTVQYFTWHSITEMEKQSTLPSTATKDTGRLYQQNHCGVNRSEDTAESWINITKRLPSRFGFPMISNTRKSGQLYVVPEEGDIFRVANNKEFAVYHMKNARVPWKKLNKGLPRENAYLGCYSEGATSDMLDPVGLYVATHGPCVFEL